MRPELRPTIYLERGDFLPPDMLRMMEGVEGMVNDQCTTRAQQVTLCRVAVCRQLERMTRHPIRWKLSRRWRENVLVQLSLWGEAHQQLTGEAYIPTPQDMDDLAGAWGRMLRG